jgi:hypothetical protein
MTDGDERGYGPAATNLALLLYERGDLEGAGAAYASAEASYGPVAVLARVALRALLPPGAERKSRTEAYLDPDDLTYE